MQVKTSELNDNALDWAVAKCEGEYPHLLAAGFRPPRYSTHWAQGGPIIEREGLRIVNVSPTVWGAVYSSGDLGREHFAATPLIAAMRCYVASKLGDTVEILDELM